MPKGKAGRVYSLTEKGEKMLTKSEKFLKDLDEDSTGSEPMKKHGAIRHFLTWETSIAELKEIAKLLKDTPVVSIPIDSTTELIIKAITKETK